MANNRKNLFYVIGAIAIIAAVVWFVLPKSSPTQQIEALLNGAAKAGAAKSVIRLNNYFTTDYSHNGSIDRATVMGFAQQFFNESDTLSVKIVKVVHDDPKLPKDALTAKAMVVLQVEGTLKEGKQKFQGIGKGGADTVLVTFTRRSPSSGWSISASQGLDASSAASLTKGLGDNIK
jgi:hypothetical protein